MLENPSLTYSMAAMAMEATPGLPIFRVARLMAIQHWGMAMAS